MERWCQTRFRVLGAMVSDQERWCQTRSDGVGAMVSDQVPGFFDATGSVHDKITSDEVPRFSRKKLGTGLNPTPSFDLLLRGLNAVGVCTHDARSRRNTGGTDLPARRSHTDHEPAELPG